MLRFLDSDALDREPDLRDSMFRDRACQFRDRLGWEVSVDATGHERDAYDDCAPLYVIWQGRDGRHAGSMRFLPTLGRTMLNDHFANLNGGRPLRHPRIWECTRFCIARDAGPETAALVMLGGAELGRGFGLSHAAGVFDARMVRIYHRLGWEPAVLGRAGCGAGAISLGLWAFGAPVADRLATRACLPPGQARRWFETAFGADRAPAHSPAPAPAPAPARALGRAV
ncbi:MAG: GNAT family N-acetyltransferase [Defluviimonas sp.]|nr:GNAT family N-acetyltransferase [Paracoccaceae bacterium]MCC0062635.1 GNAT family N-acetyltransferase [Defluviimonas sp.]